jgi:hypothetical protein
MDFYNGLAPDDKLDVFEKLWVATSDAEKKIIYKGTINRCFNRKFKNFTAHWQVPINPHSRKKFRDNILPVAILQNGIMLYECLASSSAHHHYNSLSSCFQTSSSFSFSRSKRGN